MMYIVSCLLLALLNAKFAGAESLSGRRDLFAYRGRQCWRDSYSRGVGRPLNTCPDDREKDGALCYRPCKPGYKGVGPVCWKSWRSHTRGAGKPMGCGGSRPDEDAGLCYPDCDEGYNGVGPVCWRKCPDDFPANGGAMCCKTKADCASKILSQIGAVAGKNLIGAGVAFSIPQCKDISKVPKDLSEVLPSDGKCAQGRELTEAECKILPNGDEFADWKEAGTWELPETCGCFIDQNGKRYFNRLTGVCNKWDEGEQMICKKEVPTKGESVLESENERLRTANKALREALEQMQHE